MCSNFMMNLTNGNRFWRLVWNCDFCSISDGYDTLVSIHDGNQYSSVEFPVSNFDIIRIRNVWSFIWLHLCCIIDLKFPLRVSSPSPSRRLPDHFWHSWIRSNQQRHSVTEPLASWTSTQAFEDIARRPIGWLNWLQSCMQPSHHSSIQSKRDSSNGDMQNNGHGHMVTFRPILRYNCGMGCTLLPPQCVHCVHCANGPEA